MKFKNIVIIILICSNIFCLSLYFVCINSPDNTKTTNYDEIPLRSAKHNGFDPEMALEDFKIDKTLALEIGDKILQAACNPKLLEGTSLSISECRYRDSYVVTRAGTSVGGGYNVEISWSNCEIIGMWIDE